eukprot:1708932-Amphidinium_carterae.2
MRSSRSILTNRPTSSIPTSFDFNLSVALRSKPVTKKTTKPNESPRQLWNPRGGFGHTAPFDPMKGRDNLEPPSFSPEPSEKHTVWQHNLGQSVTTTCIAMERLIRADSIFSVWWPRVIGFRKSELRRTKSHVAQYSLQSHPS